jgi:hypothetical protein
MKTENKTSQTTEPAIAVEPVLEAGRAHITIEFESFANYIDGFCSNVVFHQTFWSGQFSIWRYC